ncbi:MAG: GNAT family N-acetyltransferase [Patescibacteria group bacterium]|nr:GNAT family N-acetyltransferase [Patescibacteria group bacterium]
MQIRKATKEDISILKSLNDEFFHEEGRDWEKLVTSDKSAMFVLEEDSTILGFTGVSFDRWNKTGRIIDIFVHPKHREKGCGLSLVKHLLEYLKDKDIRCLIAEAPSLNPVLRLYLKAGFRICGYNDRYYNNSGKEVALFLSFDFE